MRLLKTALLTVCVVHTIAVVGTIAYQLAMVELHIYNRKRNSK